MSPLDIGPFLSKQFQAKSVVLYLPSDFHSTLLETEIKSSDSSKK